MLQLKHRLALLKEGCKFYFTAVKGRHKGKSTSFFPNAIIQCFFLFKFDHRISISLNVTTL